MASYSIRWKKSSVKELRKVHKETVPKIIEAVEKLALNPYHVGAKKLVGSERTFRIKVGSYRILYEIDESEIIIEIIRVRHRKEIYRK